MFCKDEMHMNSNRTQTVYCVLHLHGYYLLHGIAVNF